MRWQDFTQENPFCPAQTTGKVVRSEAAQRKLDHLSKRFSIIELPSCPQESAPRRRRAILRHVLVPHRLYCERVAENHPDEQILLGNTGFVGCSDGLQMHDCAAPPPINPPPDLFCHSHECPIPAACSARRADPRTLGLQLRQHLRAPPAAAVIASPATGV